MAAEPVTAQPTGSDWRGSVSQSRLSSLFDGWLRPSSPNASNNRASAVYMPDVRKSVSGPILLDQPINASPQTESDEANGDGLTATEVAEFEDMIV